MRGAKSVICLAASCRPVEDAGSPISLFARGRDYHRVMRKRAMLLCDRIRETAVDFEGRIFVDAGPVAERDLASRSGLGWVGKSGMLIVPGIGNMVVLAEIVCNLPLRPGRPVPDECGDCRACVDACPTGAIVADRVVDARKCLSYHTIENRGRIPRRLWKKMGSRVFGCDACSAACPHSAYGPAGDPDLAPPGERPCDLKEILAWTEADWDERTRARATRRATFAMFRRNAAITAGNSGDTSLASALKRMRNLDGPAEEIDWALEQLGKK
jgi:epoxyqueuosine reductase